MSAHPKPGHATPTSPERERVSATERAYLELWLSLTRQRWASLVLVPTEPDGSTAELAQALANVGQRLSYAPVTALTPNVLEYGSALALADLQQHVARGSPGEQVQRVGDQERGAVVDVLATVVEPEEAAAEEPGSARREARVSEARVSEAKPLAAPPPARLVISIPPVITEPLGIAATRYADAVVLAIRVGRSTMTDVRRTIALVGRDRIAGCFLMRN